MSTCLSHGLVFEANVDLRVQRTAVGPPDVRVDVMQVLELPLPEDRSQLVAIRELPSGSRQYGIYLDATGYVLHLDGLASVKIDMGLGNVELRLLNSQPLDMASVLINGYIAAFIIMARGDLVLHASAVEVDGRAAAFVGRSGQGKSTVSALACAVGAKLVTDDVLRVSRTADGRWICWPGATENRLRISAAALVADSPKTAVSGDGRLLAVPPMVTGSSILTLTEIYVPRPARGAAAVSLRSLTRQEAVIALLSFPRIVGLRDKGWLARDLRLQARLGAEVPISVADFPWGPPFDPQSLTGIVDRLRDGA